MLFYGSLNHKYIEWMKQTLIPATDIFDVRTHEDDLIFFPSHPKPDKDLCL